MEKNITKQEKDSKNKNIPYADIAQEQDQTKKYTTCDEHSIYKNTKNHKSL